MSEHEIQQRILLSLGNGDTRLWRNNVALGWVGQAQQIRQPCTVQLRPGDVVIRNGRPLHAGLCTGSSDLIGLHRIVVTPDMVGRPVALFTAIEVKGPRGRASPEQLAFVDTVRRMGGIADITRSVDHAQSILKNPMNLNP